MAKQFKNKESWTNQFTVERPQAKLWSRLSTGWRVLWKMLGAAALLLGLWTAALAVLPRVAVSPLIKLDPSNAFSAQFIVSNEGYVSLYDVKFGCTLYFVRTSDDTVFDRVVTDQEELFKVVLEPGDRTACTCFLPFVPGSTVKTADIGINVVYWSFLWPWRREVQFRFVTMKSSDGRLEWVPKERPPRK